MVYPSIPLNEISFFLFGFGTALIGESLIKKIKFNLIAKLKAEMNQNGEHK